MKVIVDVVANHTNGNLNYVADFWKNTDLYHNYGSAATVTTERPDINTGVSIATAHRSTTANVYNLKGQLVKRGTSAADALTGLPKGLYIVNGKKVVNQ